MSSTHVKSFFIAVGLMSLAGAVAHAEVLSDATKLSDLQPGTVLVVTAPLRVCANDRVNKATFSHPDSVVAGSTLDGSSAPLCTVYQPGTRLPIVSSKFDTVLARFGSDWSNYSGVTLSFNDTYLKSISTLADALFGHSKEDLTIKDLRRSFGWGVWFESATPQSIAAVSGIQIEDGSGVKAVTTGNGNVTITTIPAGANVTINMAR